MDPNTPPTLRIATLRPNLQPIEQKIADAIVNDVDFAVEATADQIAALVETSRTSVIRTAKALGYSGYQQLRVALTRELATRPTLSSHNDTNSVRGRLESQFAQFATDIHSLTSLLNDEALEASVQALAEARRVLFIATGLSGPLAALATQRLVGIGRPAEFVFDPTSQKIAASLLDSESVCFVISGSGSTHDALAAARVAAAAGATVIALTSFAQSPLAEIAGNYSLVIPTSDGTFRSELEEPSRASLLLFLEALCSLVGDARGDITTESRNRVLSVLMKTIEE